MRVLHVLHTSLPVACGYSIRTDCILRFQQLQGLQVSGVTSARHDGGFQEREQVNGVEFRRTPFYRGLELPVWREWRLMTSLEARVADEIRRLEPDVVHAHSPVLVGYPALRAAERAGLPFVYEVRDLWENASVDRGKFRVSSPWYRVARAAEGHVLRRANAVVVICAGLLDELAGRVSEREKLFLVENGVDVSDFSPLRPPAAWVAERGLAGKQIIAYAGSFQPYEGLPILVQAMPAIVRSCPAAHLVIAGDGASRPELESLATSLGVREHVTFLGRISHSEVHALYAAAEMLVYPRLLTRTTALTTPLKPLEAMAMGRAIMASDVPGLRELVSPDDRGLLFEPGNDRELAVKCLVLLGDPALRANLGKAARDWVVSERQWPTIVGRYLEVYARAGAAVAALA